MDQTFFLASNSARGFYSLYDAFPGEGCFLHIIKGGPGTGKSSFMKSIGAAARERGMDTLRVLCSGDPDSLDGLCVPALGQAWVDGTAPHAIEPRLFGVDEDYVNLGAFCRVPLARQDGQRARKLNRAYKEKYAAAYQLLAAAAAAEDGEELRDAAVQQAELGRVGRILADYPDTGADACVREKRFLSALSCRGVVRLEDEIQKLCKLNVFLRGGSAVLTEAAAMAERKCARLILCPRPLRPEQLEAVLLPELGLAFRRAPAALLVPAGEHSMSQQALSLALDALREAKSLHDRLEEIYRPGVDFAALTRYTEQTIRELFPE